MRFFSLAICALSLAGPLAAQDPHIARLAEELESTNVALRRQAVRSLGRVSQPQSITLLSSAMQTEANVSIRLEMVRVLRNIAFLRDPGFRQTLGAIANASDQAQEEDHLVRLRAIEALWEAGRKDLLDPVPFLDRCLSDPSPRLRLSAVQMLRKLGTPETIDPLGRAANDPDQPDTIRLRAIKAIGAVALMGLGPAGRSVAQANVRTTDLVKVAPPWWMSKRSVAAMRSKSVTWPLL